MDDKFKRKPKNFAEAMAWYTGTPLEEIENNTPQMTEEERKAFYENMQKLKNLSKEEFLKWRGQAAEHMKEKDMF